MGRLQGYGCVFLETYLSIKSLRLVIWRSGNLFLSVTLARSRDLFLSAFLARSPIVFLSANLA